MDYTRYVCVRVMSCALVFHLTCVISMKWTSQTHLCFLITSYVLLCGILKVPGGVGPMTIAMLLRNTWNSWRRATGAKEGE